MKRSIDVDEIIHLLKAQLRTCSSEENRDTVVKRQKVEETNDSETVDTVARKNRGRRTQSGCRQRKPTGLLHRQIQEINSICGAGDSLDSTERKRGENNTQDGSEKLAKRIAVEKACPPAQSKTFHEIYDTYKLPNTTGVQWTTYRNTADSTRANHVSIPTRSPAVAFRKLEENDIALDIDKLCAHFEKISLS